MCGFLITNLPITDPQFERALASLTHRGPDYASGAVRVGPYSIGHVRLSIIGDEKLANQPLFDRTGCRAIVFNGEIYNFRELSKKYRIELATHSDTELVLELYVRLGSKALSELHGMFALAIVDISDPEKPHLFVARDRLGAKPLYEWRKGKYLVYASESRAIIALTGRGDPDAFAIRQYYSMRSLFGERTFFKDLRNFPPATWRLDDDTQEYWRLPDSAQDPVDDETLRIAIDTAIKDRLVADVEIAAFLSGGLDSTIATLASGVHRTWCTGFAGDEDFRYADAVAAAYSLAHHKVVVDDQTFVLTARDMILRRREPLCVPNEVLIYLMCRHARESGIKCSLSGEGADELFAGYDRIFSWAANARSFHLPDFADLYCYGRVDLEVVEDALSPYMAYRDPYLIVSAFFQTGHLAALLRRLDHSSMLASVEAREPFADFRLAERLFGVSLLWKHGGSGPKSPLKRIYKDLVPPPIMERQKVGFPSPIARIFGNSRGHKAGYEAWFDFNLQVLGWQQ